MKLAEVFSSVSLGNTVLFTLIILVARGRHHGFVLAFAAAKLLQRWLSVDVAWLHKGHDLSVGEIIGPAECFLGRECLFEREVN